MGVRLRGRPPRYAGRRGTCAVYSDAATRRLGRPDDAGQHNCRADGYTDCYAYFNAHSNIYTYASRYVYPNAGRYGNTHAISYIYPNSRSYANARAFANSRTFAN